MLWKRALRMFWSKILRAHSSLNHQWICTCWSSIYTWRLSLIIRLDCITLLLVLFLNHTWFLAWRGFLNYGSRWRMNRNDWLLNRLFRRNWIIHVWNGLTWSVFIEDFVEGIFSLKTTFLTSIISRLALIEHLLLFGLVHRRLLFTELVCWVVHSV